MPAKPYSVSVIVPAYNVDSYIKECMDSLVQQTLKSIEIIVIDDCSTDNTYTILKEYEQHAFVKIVKLEKNIGLCGVRKVGIDLSQGEYVGFVDGDDFVEHTLFEELHENAVHNQSDIVICDFCRFFPNGTRKLSPHNHLLNKQIYEFNTGKIKIIHLKSFSYCDKIFHNTLFEDVKKAGYNPPDNLFMGEDLLYVLVLLYFSKHLSYVAKPLYFYRKKELINYKTTYIADTKIVMDSLINFFNKQGENSEKFQKFLYKILFYNLLLNQLRLITLASVVDAPKKTLFDGLKKIILDSKKYNYFSAKRWITCYTHAYIRWKIPVWHVKKIICNIYKKLSY